jgi:hypothetical protein
MDFSGVTWSTASWHEVTKFTVLVRKTSNLQWLLGKDVQFHYGDVVGDGKGLREGLKGADDPSARRRHPESEPVRAPITRSTPAAPRTSLDQLSGSEAGNPQDSRRHQPGSAWTERRRVDWRRKTTNATTMGDYGKSKRDRNAVVLEV